MESGAPSSEEIRSIEAAVAWLKAVRLSEIRVREKKAPPILCRHYSVSVIKPWMKNARALTKKLM